MTDIRKSLYEVTNGFVGQAYVRVYVWANDGFELSDWDVGVLMDIPGS